MEKQSLLQYFLDKSARFNNRTALVFNGKTWSYDMLKQDIFRFITGLRKWGVKAGDVVTLQAPNLPVSIMLIYAINGVGAISNMIHPLTPYDKVVENIAFTNSKFIISSSIADYGIPAKYIAGSEFFGGNSSVMELYDTCSTDYITRDTIAMYLHSGGTSAEPKTISLSAYAINSLAAGLINMYGDQLIGKKSLMVLPLFHGFGLAGGMHAMLCMGISLYVIPKFTAGTTMQLLHREQINIVLGVPVIFGAMMSELAGEDLSFIEECYVGGDAVDPNFIDQFNRFLASHHSKAQLKEGYGLTECVTVCSVNTTDSYRKGSIGKPILNVDMKIVDDKFCEQKPNVKGQIIISGDTLMEGYLGDINYPCIELDGKRWLLSGDIGFADEDGYFYFSGRIKRMAKINGVAVFPLEIERQIKECAGVNDCVVIAVDSPNRGQELVAFLEGQADTENIKSCISNKLIVWAIPKYFVKIDKFPRTLVGKIDVKKLVVEANKVLEKAEKTE